jgi:hypothetical protein
MKQNNIDKGLESLKRIKLLMEYSLDKTRSENLLEQNPQSDNKYDVTVTDAQASQTYPMQSVKLKTPSGGNVLVKYDDKVTFANESPSTYNIKSYPGFMLWVDKSKGGQGNDRTDAWVPKDLHFLIQPDSVVKIKTSDGKVYRANYQNSYLESIKSWEDFYSLMPKPNTWSFSWYYDNEGNAYVEDRGSVGNFVRDHEEAFKLLLWIGGAIIAGILTGGLADLLIGTELVAAEAFTVLNYNVTTRALAIYLGEAGVWSTKAMIELNEGDEKGALVDFLFAFVLPLCHASYFKLGINATEKEVAALGQKLIGKSEKEIEQLMTKGIKEGGLSQQEKQLFKRILSIKPEKFKEEMVKVFEDASQKLESRGLKPSTVMQKSLNSAQGTVIKTGGLLSKTWLTKTLGVFAHDIALINLVESIAKKFGVIEVEKHPEVIEHIIKELENTNGDKKKQEEIINDYTQKLKESSKIEDLSKAREKIYKVDTSKTVSQEQLDGWEKQNWD